MTLQAPPVVIEHEGVSVVRDDFFPGGTKARFLPALFEDCDELVYASPCEGGAQTAIATVAAQLGKRATIFIAARVTPHERALMVKRLGGRVMAVTPGYLTTVQARAREYAAGKPGVKLAPFGLHVPGAEDWIANAARATGLQPREVWCASGSGLLARGLGRAWPKALIACIRVGRELQREDLPRHAIPYIHEQAFGQRCKRRPPFPSDPHYDAKAWDFLMRARKEGVSKDYEPGELVFWNVTGPAEP